jgi:hypothetical protein
LRHVLPIMAGSSLHPAQHDALAGTRRLDRRILPTHWRSLRKGVGWAPLPNPPAVLGSSPDLSEGLLLARSLALYYNLREKKTYPFV